MRKPKISVQNWFIWKNHGITSNTNLEEYKYKILDVQLEEINCNTDDTNEDKDIDAKTKKCKSCLNFSICCYRILNRYNLLTWAYSVIGLAFECVDSFVYQVTCERNFSILKFIKDRLRSNLGQEKLECCILMSIEKDILNNLNF